MIEFDKFVFKQAVTYCSDKLVEIPLKDQGAVYIGGVNGSGKAQPLYSLIKIPNGWVKMGDIKIGDIVNTPDGKTAPVTDIFPQGIKDVYRITFEDGRTTDCCGDHLWKVFNHSWTYKHPRNGPNKKRSSIKVENPERILSLKEIIDLKLNTKSDIFIPLPKFIFNENKDLPLDPYILGLLIGDGSISSGSVEFTNIDEENINNLKSKLIEGYYLHKTPNSITYRLTFLPEFSEGNKGSSGLYNYYVKTLKNLKLWGHRSWEKFIPEIYKEASTEQRLELLRGLMDTDGEVGKHTSKKGNHSGGSISYSTSSHRLALDVQYLVRSLGGLCKISFRKTSYTYKGVKKQGRTSYRCNIRHDFPENFMKLSRKSERCTKALDTTLKCKIKSIKYLGESKCQCILVDHPDHLYITDNFIVTHNSLPFNVLFNILFGYTPLSSKGKRKLIANNNYYGRVDFKLNNIPFSIEQYFNNSEFQAKGLGRDGYNIIKNGESLGIAGGIPECEKFIAKMLPFTPDEFNGFYYLSQDSMHVLAYGKGSERLNYLSNVFGFDIYDKIRVELKIKLDEIDVQLADAVKAQEEVRKLREKLLKYPDEELLNNRISLFSYHLEDANKERKNLILDSNDFNQNIKYIISREKLENSLKDYEDVRNAKEIIFEIQNLRKDKRDLEQIIQKNKVEQKIHDKFNLVKKYINQDVEYLSKGLDKLIEKKGLAASLNLSVARRETLKGDIDRNIKKLIYKSLELPNLYEEINKKLIEDQTLLKKCNADLLTFTNLKGDGGKCSRCGHILETKHIISEVNDLNTKIKELKLSIKECKAKELELNNQINILNKIKEYENELKNITYTGDKIDILKLSSKITKVRLFLENAKEAQRLKKEISEFSKSKYTTEEALINIDNINNKINKLSDERDRAVQKEMIENQLLDIPIINSSVDNLQKRLDIIKDRLKIIEYAIPLITSDIREAEIIKNVVKDYNIQLNDQIKLSDKIDILHTKRRILNACWKSYAPGKMKKEAVAKISTLIAQKLNVFTSFVFDEDIYFTTDPSENSVDILFKRGNQPPRDVRFLNGGHKKRFLISLIPVLAGLVSIKKRTNIIIIDEIDANLDKIGRESIGEFLIPYLKEKFKTVIVISPSYFSGGQLIAPIPLDHFDKVWIPSYKDGVSYLDVK